MPSALPPKPSIMSAPLSPAAPLLRLTRNEAQARTTIAQRAAALPLLLMGTPWAAHLQPVATPATSATLVAPQSYRLRVEWGGALFALHLPNAAVEQLVSAALSGASLPALPPSLATVALETALADTLQSLQSLGRGAPLLLPPSQADETLPPHALELKLQAQDGSNALAGLLFTDSLGLLMLAGLVAQRPPQPRASTPDLRLRLHAEIGSTLLPADILGQLEPADVVLMDICLATPGRSLWLSPDGRSGVHVHWPAASDGAPLPPLTVIHPWTHTMSTDTESAAPTAPISLESVPVRLSFDLGDLEITLGELQALQPGQALDLGHPLSGAVRIRANGALLGEGDLVEIDGQMGVSIRRLFHTER
jgi:type III secretion protein Q